MSLLGNKYKGLEWVKIDMRERSDYDLKYCIKE